MTMRVLAVVLALIASPAMAEPMKMAVTTSFHNSGLSDVLLPVIEEDTGIEVQLIVVGTGQAIKLGQAGDVDAILVHSRAAEDAARSCTTISSFSGRKRIRPACARQTR